MTPAELALANAKREAYASAVGEALRAWQPGSGPRPSTSEWRAAMGKAMALAKDVPGASMGWLFGSKPITEPQRESARQASRSVAVTPVTRQQQAVAQKTRGLDLGL